MWFASLVAQSFRFLEVISKNFATSRPSSTCCIHNEEVHLGLIFRFVLRVLSPHLRVSLAG
jgi:hypothetical protein